MRVAPHLLHDGLLLNVAVLGLGMLYELVLPVVSNPAGLAAVRFLLGVSPFVVVAIANRRESLQAVLALVGLFASVDADVHQEVASLVKLFVAVSALVVRHVLESRLPQTARALL